ncbi:MAG: VOC family protein [SAR324 cluster bacterium]|nr:VOC family protein [SAR324 cluster bacterium]
MEIGLNLAYFAGKINRKIPAGVCEKLEAAGVPVPRKPGPMKFGGREIAFIRDPDNRSIELIQVGE